MPGPGISDTFLQTLSCQFNPCHFQVQNLIVDCGVEQEGRKQRDKIILSMSARRLLRRVRNDPKFLCKYVIWTNVLCLLYFIVIVDRDTATDQTKKNDELETFKFKDFDLERWKKAEHFKLEDSNEIFFE